MKPSVQVAHLTPDEFVDVTVKHDNTWLNWALGSLLDTRASTEGGVNTWLPKERILVIVTRHGELLIVLTKMEGDFTWTLTHPRDVVLSREDIEESLETLASTLPSILGRDTVSPDVLLKLDEVMGPVLLTEPFLRIWTSYAASHFGIHLKLIDHQFHADVSYATSATLPPLSSAFSSGKYDIHIATPDVDIKDIVPLYIEFTKGVWHSPATQEVAITALQQAARRKQLWFAYHKNEDHQDASNTISSFVLLGRETPNTISIRNVYVSPAFRRQGIAEALVRAVTRFYLGVEPLGFHVREPSLARPKKEVLLNTTDPGARRLYVRCGFLLDGDQTDAATGQKRWYPTSWFGVRLCDGE